MKAINFKGKLLRKILVAFIVTMTVSIQAYAEDGKAWLEKISAAEKVEYSTGIMKQIITTSSGSERMLTMKAWSAEHGDLSLMVYTDPPRVKGDKILQRDGGDNIWYYMKRRDVTRHFTGSARKQSAMGSDFSYEDLSQGDFLEDYTAEVLGEEKIDGVKCIKLKCTPTESGPSYDHIILWAGMDDFLTRKIDYFDSDGYLKTLTITDFKTIEGRKIAMNMEMTNKREGSRTVIITESISFKKKPDPSLFTKQALSRELN